MNECANLTLPEMIERTLWYQSTDGRAELSQIDLCTRTEPLVILGEAGMGKSRLLEWLAASPGYKLCTAGKLIRSYDASKLLASAHTLVIDALDEVSSKGDGDAVDLVLRKLDELGCPRFVLSCRVADWRSATGLEAIREQYSEEPLELHLEPFDNDDASSFLSASLGAERAKIVVEHFCARGLSALLGNPQTLELIARVARTGNLPETRSKLFESGIELLRGEYRDGKGDVEPAKEAGLDAAGAACAGLILTGNEAIVRKASANLVEGELKLVEIIQLAGGDAIKAMLGTRLFKADGAERFCYLHRRIGEFLAARWLAKQADTPSKRRRLFALFHSHGLVPASLRGLHAWLARDPALAQAVIAADPMGVIEYGDADDLTVEQARSLLHALELLATENPGFHDWKSYSLRGITQIGLVEDVRRLITSAETALGLRILVLQALSGSQLVTALADDLLQILLDPQAIFASRSIVGKALIELAVEVDWPTTLHTLEGYGDELSIRLAIELIGAIGYESFGNNFIVELVIAHAKVAGRTAGVLMGLERRLPESKIEGVLDCLAKAVKTLGKPSERPGNDDLTDLANQLIVRALSVGGITAEQLWSWMEPFDARMGYRHETRQQRDALIQTDDTLRRAVQRFVLLDLPSEQSPWQRAWRMSDRSTAFTPTADDVLALLAALNPADRSDERWKDLVQLTQHAGEKGSEVRAAAEKFAAHRPDLLVWLDKLAEPLLSEWQIKEAERQRRLRAKQAVEHAEHRKHYLAHIDEMRLGYYGNIIAPTNAYLNLLNNIGADVPAHKRVSQWLGDNIGDAAHEGFEAFLLIAPPKPSAQDIANSFAQGKHFDAGYIIVAALAERHRTGRGFADLIDERLMAGLFVLRRTSINDHAGITGLLEALESCIKTRGAWKDAMRLYHEPQFQAQLEFIDGLYALMRDDAYAELGAELAAEWLDHFPNVSVASETELTDRLISSGRLEVLRRAAVGRVGLAEDERRRNWEAIGLIIDFEQTASRLEAFPIEPELLWHLRERAGGRFGDDISVTFTAAQLEWIVTIFRPLWPMAEHPRGGSYGDTNPWDASEYVKRSIQRLGNHADEVAVDALIRLRDAPVDGYTLMLKIVAAEQTRIRVEAAYAPPSLAVLDAITHSRPPVSIADLQALVVEELALAQAKIKSDDAESWRGFYENGIPRAEEGCRDHLLGLLRQGLEGITFDPEAHVAADKEVDIACSVGAQLRLPIEIKGQWHRELWQGADAQLERLYTPDWRAGGRGIYLVLWFGDQQAAHKSLTSPGRKVERPQTPEQLQKMLTTGSQAARDGRVIVVVLDLSRPS